MYYILSMCNISRAQNHRRGSTREPGTIY